MTPYWADDRVTLYHGDSLAVLRELESESVQCCVTSPPYFGLRDYGTATWEGGDAECTHQYAKGGRNPETAGKQLSNQGTTFSQYEHECKKCGATRIDDQMGLEATPEAYVCRMVELFRELRRVLRNDGTFWLNIGDSYAGSGGPGSQYDNKDAAGKKGSFTKYDNPNRKVAGIKPKDLIGIPWMLAFALRADGWWLRSDIIWSKPNPMPESVTDRPTKSHEYVFLLTKSERYYYDADAVREGEQIYVRNAGGYVGFDATHVGNNQKGGFADKDVVTVGRNARSVWEIPTHPYPKAHFATFPEALVEPCIKAGTSERGCCPECGAPWDRVVEKGKLREDPQRMGRKDRNKADFDGQDYAVRESTLGLVRDVTTTGWQPTCKHTAEPVPCTVLDPFMGSGTTAWVAKRLGRKAIGIDLSAAYLDLAIDRNRQGALL